MSTTTSTTVPIGERPTTAFAALRAAFERNLATGEEVGASLAVLEKDEPVVDLWAG